MTVIVTPPRCVPFKDLTLPEYSGKRFDIATSNGCIRFYPVYKNAWTGILMGFSLQMKTHFDIVMTWLTILFHK